MNILKINEKPLNLMIQGTTSSAGKSFLVAALCRILSQDGFTVSPFKSQNMALNSYITSDGKEIGRAQAVQANCANQEPNTYMNPILLKPNTDMGSQVIVQGEVWKNLSAVEYFSIKNQLIPVIKDSYNNLACNNDIILIEGAGSPAEINLNKNDIVNMGIAKMFNAPVILVADIDRGGVFASLYGTLKLLSQNEQKMIKGFIINKFRGDLKLLQPGIKMLEEKINIPCLGVIPYQKFALDEEDSLTERFKYKKRKQTFKIGILKLKHISNISDFTVFDYYDDINITYIEDKSDFLNSYDLLIIPGSKNVVLDLKDLRERQLEPLLKQLINETFTIAICGGYQMLGQTIKDLEGVESQFKITKGLELFDFDTIIETQKDKRQISGKTENNEPIHGYMLHMGKTNFKKDYKPFCFIENKSDGFCSDAIIGTYIHGLFDNDQFRNNLLKKLGYKGNSFSFREYQEREYNKLADFIRIHIDLKKIYQILGLK